MIIMALDHVRHFFHHEAFLFEPTDLSRTTALLFFTRWITHFCAPVFVFLAGISAYLYGVNKTKNELAYYLFTRGLWLVFVELFIIGLGQTFNPSYPMFNLQVIWAIGISMIVLSAMIYLKRQVILAIAILLIAGHNLLDNVHIPGGGLAGVGWSILHEPANFFFGRFNIFIQYPVIPWIGILAMGYYLGSLFSSPDNPEKIKTEKLLLGVVAIAFFLFLRTLNLYGDAAHWYYQKNVVFSLLSFLNLTKYPPSVLYILMTLGPAMIFLAYTEKPLNSFFKKIAVFGRVPFFYYVVHIYLIHLLAMLGAVISGYRWSDMILKTKVNRVPELNTYGFNLFIVYLVWIGLILLMFPCCKWYDQYKRTHLSTQRWLSYL
jgi:uncharacterized membrane protein